jgi:conjugative relaxase-like TrwC/TraI family protein
MLTIHRLTTDRTNYYLSDLARELPPGHPTGGVWAGGAADALGLHGPTDADALVSLLGGVHPTTGIRLRSDRATVLAYDLTFSAPKSASVLVALAGDEVAQQVMAAHRSALRGAVSYVDDHAVTAARRLGPERTVMATDGMVAAAFSHGLSRNGDPHLHTHVVMANLVHGDDGRWSACDQRGLWAHRRAASELYQAHLRAEMTERLGVSWRMAPGAAGGIVGLEPALLAEFSSRAAQIRQHGFATGVRSAYGNRIAWAATRPAKEAGAPFAELVPEWQRRATACGAPLELGAVLGRAQPGRPVVAEHAFAAELALAADGGVRRRDVAAAFAQGATRGARAEVIERMADVWVPSPSGAVGVAEPALARRRIIPGGYHLRAIGPRPLDPAAQACWRDAAQQIDQYRERWRVSGASHALGSEEAQGSWPTARLIDHVRTSAALHQARARLGYRAPPVVDLGRGR